jgi:hypothetical protein
LGSDRRSVGAATPGGIAAPSSSWAPVRDTAAPQDPTVDRWVAVGPSPSSPRTGLIAVKPRSRPHVRRLGRVESRPSRRGGHAA